MGAAKALGSLRICAGSPEPSLLDNAISTVKPVFSGHSIGRPKIVFRNRLSLNAGQKYCRYVRPSLSYHLSLRPLFCLFLIKCIIKTGFTVPQSRVLAKLISLYLVS